MVCLLVIVQQRLDWAAAEEAASAPGSKISWFTSLAFGVRERQCRELRDISRVALRHTVLAFHHFLLWFKHSFPFVPQLMAETKTELKAQ